MGPEPSPHLARDRAAADFRFLPPQSARLARFTILLSLHVCPATLDCGTLDCYIWPKRIAPSCRARRAGA